MFFLYSFLIVIYGLSIRIASLFNSKARRFIRGRQNQDLNDLRLRLDQWRQFKIYWIHVSSYGEFEMARPIIRALQKDTGNKFVVSFFSPSGYDDIQLNENDFVKIYLPIDHYASQKKLIEVINPYKVIFIKYDFWFNLLRAMKERDIPYYFISLHLNNDHYLLKRSMRPFLDLIAGSTRLYGHNETSIKILSDHNILNTSLLGDTRLMQVFQNKDETPRQLNWLEESSTITFGSILDDEYDMVSSFVNENRNWNVVIAPHEINDKSLSRLSSMINEPVDYFSGDASLKTRILVVDTMGDLKYLYRSSSLAYVGGGFEKGPHNVLEPMVYGIPTIIGPNIKKFPMAKFLAEKNLLTIINDTTELTPSISTIINSQYKERVSNINMEMEQLHLEFDNGFNRLQEDLK